MLKLANGVLIPVIGLGTSTTHQGNEIFNKEETCKDIIKRAIELGYRHIDTAMFYRNEHVIGQAIKVFMIR